MARARCKSAHAMQTTCKNTGNVTVGVRMLYPMQQRHTGTDRHMARLRGPPLSKFPQPFIKQGLGKGKKEKQAKERGRRKTEKGKKGKEKAFTANHRVSPNILHMHIHTPFSAAEGTARSCLQQCALCSDKQLHIASQLSSRRPVFFPFAVWWAPWRRDVRPALASRRMWVWPIDASAMGAQKRMACQDTRLATHTQHTHTHVRGTAVASPNKRNGASTPAPVAHHTLEYSAVIGRWLRHGTFNIADYRPNPLIYQSVILPVFTSGWVWLNPPNVGFLTGKKK